MRTPWALRSRSSADRAKTLATGGDERDIVRVTNENQDLAWSTQSENPGLVVHLSPRRNASRGTLTDGFTWFASAS
jgi:hypothetical protein